MDSCSRCGWSGPAGHADCPRCGQPLNSASDVEPTLVQTSARPVLLLKLLGGELPPEEWELEGVPVGIGRLDDSEITLPHRSVSRHHALIVPSASVYELDAALAAAGPAEPPPPPQPVQPPADYQRAQPAQAPAAYEHTQAAPLPDVEKTVPPPSAPPPVAQPASPPADYQRTPPLQPA